MIIVPTGRNVPGVLDGRSQQVGLTNVMVDFSARGGPTFGRLGRAIVRFYYRATSLPCMFRSGTYRPLFIVSYSVVDYYRRHPRPVFTFNIP